jgi:hypothetical protein
VKHGGGAATVPRGGSVQNSDRVGASPFVEAGNGPVKVNEDEGSFSSMSRWHAEQRTPSIDRNNGGDGSGALDLTRLH